MLQLLIKEKLRQTIKLFRSYGLLYIGCIIAILIGFSFIKEIILNEILLPVSLIIEFIKEYNRYIYGITLLIINYLYITSRFPLIKVSGPTLFYFRGTKYLKMIIGFKIIYILTSIISLSLVTSLVGMLIDLKIRSIIINFIAIILAILSSNFIWWIKYNSNNKPLRLIYINLVITVVYFISPIVFIILELFNLYFLIYYIRTQVKFNYSRYLNDMDNMYKCKIAMINGDNDNMIFYARLMSERNERQRKISLMDIKLEGKFLLLSKMLITLLRPYLSELTLSSTLIIVAIILRLFNIDLYLMFMIISVMNIINILIGSSMNIFINIKKGLVIPYNDKTIFKVQAIMPISILIIIALIQLLLNASLSTSLLLAITYISIYSMTVLISMYKTKYLKYAKAVNMILVLGINILIL